MSIKLNKPYLFAFVAALALFILNNFILGAIVPRLPGGSATGITAAFIVTFSVLKTQRFGVISVIFSIYGLIGIPSHLATGDFYYLWIVLSLVVSALAFDVVVFFSKFQKWGLILGYLIFVFGLNFINAGLQFFIKNQHPMFDLKNTGLGLFLGFSGMLLAYLVHLKFRFKKKNPKVE